MNRPHVFVNMASSVDGKITTRTREAFSLGSDEDRAMMELLRERADAVLIGAGTVRDEDPPIVIRNPVRQRRRLAAKGAAHPLNVVVSSSLGFKLQGSKFFSCDETYRIVYTGHDVDRERAAEVATRAELVKVDSDEDGQPSLGGILEDLHRRGVRELLLEGGGTLNFAMLSGGYVDEVFLTLCPIIIGGVEAPTTFAGEGFVRQGIRSLVLVSSRVNRHGELFLHYRLGAAAGRRAAA